MNRYEGLIRPPVSEPIVSPGLFSPDFFSSPITLFMTFIIIIMMIGHAIAQSVKFCLAWYFAFHFVKKFKHLPLHMRPPGWPPTNL